MDARWPRRSKVFEKVDNNLYSLGEAHQRELDVLIEQGNLRIQQSNRGKASVAKRKAKKVKKAFKTGGSLQLF